MAHENKEFMADMSYETKEKDNVLSGTHNMERNSDEKAAERRRSTLGNFGGAGDDKAIEGQLFSMNDIDPA